MPWPPPLFSPTRLLIVIKAHHTHMSQTHYPRRALFAPLTLLFVFSNARPTLLSRQEPRPPERFLEMHRLAHIVKTIDRAVAVVPKGALLVEVGYSCTSRHGSSSSLWARRCMWRNSLTRATNSPPTPRCFRTNLASQQNCCSEASGRPPAPLQLASTRSDSVGPSFMSFSPRRLSRPQASRKIRPYRNFEGLSAEAARDLRSYFHFRNPESIEVGTPTTSTAVSVSIPPSAASAKTMYTPSTCDAAKRAARCQKTMSRSCHPGSLVSEPLPPRRVDRLGLRG